MKQADSRRTFWLSGAGAVAGLVLAGRALLLAQGTQSRGVPPQDVALVNQRPILQSDFVTQTQAETGIAFNDTSAADRRRVLVEMIDEELLVQRGLEVDLPASDPDVRTALVNGVDLQVDAEILAARPDDTALRAYYTAHADHYTTDGTMDLRDLVGRASPPDLPRCVAALRGGMAVDSAVATFGLADAGRIGRGDNFDFGVKAKLGEVLYKVATSLSAGQVSDPIDDGGQTHILVMLHRKRATQLGFAEARDSVWQDYQRAARAQVEKANLDFLRSRADIEVADGLAR